MNRVLGVNVSGADAFLIVLDVDADGAEAVVAEGPHRVCPVAAGDAGDALVRSLREWRRVLAEARADAVALLLPESEGRTQRVHAQWQPRIRAETLAGLAAGLEGVPFDPLARATVRSRLGLGKLDDERKKVPADGPYWQHRSLALFAARALAAHAAQNGWPSRAARPDGTEEHGDGATG